MTLNEIIKEIRKGAGLTQRQFADRLGCSPNHISQAEMPFEKSRRRVGTDLIEKIAKEFSTTDAELIALENRMLLAKELAETSPRIRQYVSIPGSSGGSITHEFIQKVKSDYQKLIAENKQISEKGYIENAISMLAEKAIISRRDVVKLAAALDQPINEYLALLRYVPRKKASSYPQSVTGELPQKFLDRLKTDINRLDISKKKEFLESIQITEDEFDAVMRGELFLSRSKIIEIAQGLQQSIDEYALLANYVTADLKKAIEHLGFTGIYALGKSTPTK